MLGRKGEKVIGRKGENRESKEGEEGGRRRGRGGATFIPVRRQGRGQEGRGRGGEMLLTIGARGAVRHRGDIHLVRRGSWLELVMSD